MVARIRQVHKRIPVDNRRKYSYVPTGNTKTLTASATNSPLLGHGNARSLPGISIAVVTDPIARAIKSTLLGVEIAIGVVLKARLGNISGTATSARSIIRAITTTLTQGTATSSASRKSTVGINRLVQATDNPAIFRGQNFTYVVLSGNIAAILKQANVVRTVVNVASATLNKANRVAKSVTATNAISFARVIVKSALNTTISNTTSLKNVISHTFSVLVSISFPVIKLPNFQVKTATASSSISFSSALGHLLSVVATSSATKGSTHIRKLQVTASTTLITIARSVSSTIVMGVALGSGTISKAVSLIKSASVTNTISLLKSSVHAFTKVITSSVVRLLSGGKNATATSTGTPSLLMPSAKAIITTAISISSLLRSNAVVKAISANTSLALIKVENIIKSATATSATAFAHSYPVTKIILASSVASFIKAMTTAFEVASGAVASSNRVVGHILSLQSSLIVQIGKSVQSIMSVVASSSPTAIIRRPLVTSITSLAVASDVVQVGVNRLLQSTLVIKMGNALNVKKSATSVGVVLFLKAATQALSAIQATISTLASRAKIIVQSASVSSGVLGNMVRVTRQVVSNTSPLIGHGLFRVISALSTSVASMLAGKNKTITTTANSSATSSIFNAFAFFSSWYKRSWVQLRTVIGRSYASTSALYPAIDEGEVENIIFDFGYMLPAGGYISQIESVTVTDTATGISSGSYIASQTIRDSQAQPFGTSVGSGSVVVLVRNLVGGHHYSIKCSAMSNYGDKIALESVIYCVTPN